MVKEGEGGDERERGGGGGGSGEKGEDGRGGEDGSRGGGLYSILWRVLASPETTTMKNAQLTGK